MGALGPLAGRRPSAAEGDEEQVQVGAKGERPSRPPAAVRRSARVGRTAASHAGVAFCAAIRQADALQRCDAQTKSSWPGSVGFSLPLHQPFTTDTQPASRRPRQPTLHLWATPGPRPSFRKVQRSRTSGDGVEGEGLAWCCVAIHRRARKPPKPWHSALSTQTRMGDAGAHGGASPSSRQQGGRRVAALHRASAAPLLAARSHCATAATARPPARCCWARRERAVPQRSAAHSPQPAAHHRRSASPKPGERGRGRSRGAALGSSAPHRWPI
jgi:hypothetical protein